MRIYFDNLDEKYLSGMKHFLAYHGIESGRGELSVHIRKTDENIYRILKNGNNVTLEVNDLGYVFRAVTILKEKIAEENFCFEEKRYFKTCGAMFDGSQANSLMNIQSCKKMLIILAGMGFNMMMLYCEDCYTIDGEPYWGNMRPRYSKEDFRELDDFAYSLGIEMIPCIQTLGHLTQAIKKYPYKEIADTDSVLMVGCEKVYELIDKLISQVSSCFRSRRIHVGLDEAWNLGFGNYLKNNGYKPQSELMPQHVKRVCEITDKYDLKPMMWSDMFFRAKSKTHDYYDYSVNFSAEDRVSVPDNMSLVYWDYYHFDTEEYDKMLNIHKKLSDKIIFAGCARSTFTFGSHHDKTLATMNPALSVCKKEGVSEVIATVWGDDQRESSTFAILPGLQLFAEHMYSLEPDEETLSRRFKSCVNADYAAFCDISLFDCIPEYNGKNLNNSSVSRVCMWQDILLGLFDKDLRNTDFSQHYEKLAEKMAEYAKKYVEFKTLFEFYAQLAKVLKTKAYLGIRITAAYRSDNREELKLIRDEVLPKLQSDMKKLREAHRRYYFEEYKPIGWEILDIRYGGAIMRVDTAIFRLESYLSGKCNKLDELEEERLSMSGCDEVKEALTYRTICSASSL